ncbi:MAG: hypothetical protein ACI94Y_003378 [Maribacter sp.]|jgi:hypothetical protein
MKLTYTILFILCSFILISAQEVEQDILRDTTKEVAEIALELIQEEKEDSIPNEPTEYVGYRVFISNPELIKEKKTNFKIKIKVTNTGSSNLSSSDKKEYQFKLIVKSENELIKINKETYADLIHQKIRNSNLNLSSGQSQTLELKINIPKDRRMDEGGFTVRRGNRGIKDYSRDLCPDLVLDSLVLVKRDKKNAYVTFQVRNEGKGAINVIGDPSDKGDNIAIGAYYSGTKKYSRGALLAGQTFLVGLKESKGILFPGQTMTGKMKISRKKQSKYTKVLIIQVDSQSIVIECNETNNTGSVLVR